MIGELVRNIIITNVGVKTITKNVHPSAVNAKGFPKVTYELVVFEPKVCNDGVYLSNYNYQLDAYSATSYADAEALAKAVTAALQLYSDPSVKKIIVTDVLDAASTAEDGKDSPSIYRKSIRAVFSI